MGVQGGKGLVLSGFGNDLPQGLSLRTVVEMEAVFHVTYMAKSGTVKSVLPGGGIRCGMCSKFVLCTQG